MRMVCFCCVCKTAQPYDDVVSVKSSAKLHGDICVKCAIAKGDKWIYRHVVARHLLTVEMAKDKLKAQEKGDNE